MRLLKPRACLVFSFEVQPNSPQGPHSRSRLVRSQGDVFTPMMSISRGAFA
jgi:hypothetical protein